MKKLLFIVNPRAGRTKSSAPLFDAVAAFSRAGYLVRVFVTEAGGDACRAAAEWGSEYDVVACAGGDGTLNETISGLMTLEQRPLLGYLPNGSTNDFAASLHLSSDPRLAALDIAGGQPHPLDIGRHNDRYFAYVASFGAFTRSSYSASQAAKKRAGTLRVYPGGAGRSGLPAALQLLHRGGRRGFRGGFHLRGRVQLHLHGRTGKAGSQPRQDGRRAVRAAAAADAKTALDLQNLITAMTGCSTTTPVLFSAMCATSP